MLLLLSATAAPDLPPLPNLPPLQGSNGEMAGVGIEPSVVEAEPPLPPSADVTTAAVIIEGEADAAQAAALAEPVGVPATDFSTRDDTIIDGDGDGDDDGGGEEAAEPASEAEEEHTEVPPLEFMSVDPLSGGSVLRECHRGLARTVCGTGWGHFAALAFCMLRGCSLMEIC